MPLHSKPLKILGRFNFLFLGHQILVRSAEPIELADFAEMQDCINRQLAQDWFYETKYDYMAARLQENFLLPPKHMLVPIRSVFASDTPFSSLAARALAILNWKKTVLFCSQCGSPLVDSPDETAQICTRCATIFYPTLMPAIIVQIYKEGKLLLARHTKRNANVYTCLAGYLEAGESLEECIRREIFEETSLEVEDIKYRKSQSWPFPNQLMIGFTAKWKSGRIKLEKTEIEDAGWFSPEQLPPIPNEGSLAYDLISTVSTKLLKGDKV